MLIRSQDKKSIVNLNNIDSMDICGCRVDGMGVTQDDDNANTWYVAYSGYEKMNFIGRYSSEEKAIKVLDMIQKEYIKFMYGPGGKDALTGEMFQPFGFIPPKVFQMPLDEEVEV